MFSLTAELVVVAQGFTAVTLTLFAIAKLALTPLKRRTIWTWVASGSAVVAAALISIVAAMNGNPVRGLPTAAVGVLALALTNTLVLEHRARIRGGSCDV